MRNYKTIRNVCATNSVHALLQFLLLIPEIEWGQTYFFFGEGIGSSIREHFKNNSTLIEKQHSFIDNLRLYYFTSWYKWPFLLNKHIKRFGCDHHWFSFWVFRRFDFELLEDGSLNYVENDIFLKWKKLRFRGLKKMLLGPTFIPHKRVGDEKTCKRIHLTGFMEGEVLNDPRVVKQSFTLLWNQSPESKKKRILDIFCMKNIPIDILKIKETIIITDPFSEDGLISEEKKIKIVKKMIDYMGRNDKCVIKPHPREKTDYKLYFPDVYVMEKKAPVQLLSLLGVQFENVCSVCSTASFVFPYKYNLYYFGTDIDAELEVKYPDWTRENVKNLPPNITLMTINI